MSSDASQSNRPVVPASLNCPVCGTRTTTPVTEPGPGPLSCSSCGEPFLRARTAEEALNTVLGCRRGFLWCLVIGSALFLLVGYFHNPFDGEGREAARRSSCRNNLKQIGLALHNYHEVHGCFPPAYIADKNGKPMHSWRVLILPYLEHGGLYKKYKFNEPWNGPNNRKLAHLMPQAYRCPSCDHYKDKVNEDLTHYVAVVGLETIFPDAACRNFKECKDEKGETVMVIDTPGQPVHWMAPDDVSPEEFLRRMTAARETGGHHKAVTNLLFVDGSVRTVVFTIEEATLKALTTIAAGDTVDRDDE